MGLKPGWTLDIVETRKKGNHNKSKKTIKNLTRILTKVHLFKAQSSRTTFFWPLLTCCKKPNIHCSQWSRMTPPPLNLPWNNTQGGAIYIQLYPPCPWGWSLDRSGFQQKVDYVLCTKKHTFFYRLNLFFIRQLVLEHIA